jgi:hypothetical protein
MILGNQNPLLTILAYSDTAHALELLNSYLTDQTGSVDA